VTIESARYVHMHMHMHMLRGDAACQEKMHMHMHMHMHMLKALGRCPLVATPWDPTRASPMGPMLSWAVGARR